MAQNFIDNCYQIDHLIADGSSDLQDMETNFAVLKGSFSGASQPADCGDYSVVPGLCWYYTTKKQMRYRNAADSGWVYLFPGDTNQKLWVYRNDVVEGMVYVNVTDRVLAIKGGSYSYNVSGGNTAGSWLSTHTHTRGSFAVNTRHRHGVGTYTVPDTMQDVAAQYGACYTNYQGSTTQALSGTSAAGGPSSSWRISACVGILVKPDI